jgi:glucose/arabinose dehydrogenase
MSRRHRVMIAAMLLLLLVAGVRAMPTSIAPFADRETFLPLAMRGGATALPPADEATQRIKLPAGFAIRIYAQNLNGTPRFMAWGPDGQPYVSLMNSGEIARLPDRNRDGKADGVEIVASGLYLPHGLEWRDGWLYVAQGNKIERLRDADGNGSLETRSLVTSNIPEPEGHRSRTVHFGPDGRLYVSAGSSCNVCVEDDPRRAAILRFNADGSIPADNPYANDPDPRKRAVWATGLRNSVDFLWTPGGALWANHNGSDGLGDNAPPEEMIIPVQGGMSHGWPYCYTPSVGLNSTDEVRDNRIALPNGFSCDDAVPARFTDLAHSAPLGMTLGTGSGFPAAMRDDLFIAYHGSWNTDNPANYRDCKVQRIVIENGQPVRAETFANGWREDGQKCGAAWGRPADVVFGPDGSMLISDDKAGRVYRVVYVGQ